MTMTVMMTRKMKMKDADTDDDDDDDEFSTKGCIWGRSHTHQCTSGRKRTRGEIRSQAETRAILFIATRRLHMLFLRSLDLHRHLRQEARCAHVRAGRAKSRRNRWPWTWLVVGLGVSSFSNMSLNLSVARWFGLGKTYWVIG
jgi:hypothetical protein